MQNCEMLTDNTKGTKYYKSKLDFINLQGVAHHISLNCDFRHKFLKLKKMNHLKKYSLYKNVYAENTT